MANAATVAGMAVGRVQTGTWKLYENFWQVGESNVMRIMAISDSLTNLAEVHNRKMSSTLLASYVAVLEDLNPEEIILAFSRTHDEDSFWPTPGRLRGLSGREPLGDPLEREADAALRVLLSKMRNHGWELKPKLGAIIRTDDPATGRLLKEPLREATTHHGLPHKTMLTVAVLGWGDILRGLALLKDHPAVVRPEAGDVEFKVNALKQADELRRRFVEAYRANSAAMGGR